MMNKPAARTRKARRKASSMARTALRQYDAQTYGEADETAQPFRVQRLLWAMAFLHRALAMETSRAMGDPYATAESVRQELLGDAYRLQAPHPVAVP